MADFFKHVLDTVGDGSGTQNFNGNHAATTAWWKPTSDKKIYGVSVLRLVLSDALGGAFDWTKYGDLAALTNGLKVQLIEDDGSTAPAGKLLEDFLPVSGAGASLVKTNADLVAFGTSRIVDKTAGHLELDIEIGRGITTTRWIAVQLDDNFTGLDLHYFAIVGTSELYAPLDRTP